MSKKEISRRKFMQKSALSVAAASSIGAFSSCSKEQPQEAKSEDMPKMILGKTGLEVSMLSFGGGSQFMKNKDGAWQEMLEKAVSLGVNLFDTASEYIVRDDIGEVRYGDILSKYRDKIYIATKFTSRNPDEIMSEVEQSLKNLRTDYFDILMIHNICKSDELSTFEKDSYRIMRKLKDEGVARNIGFSSMSSATRSKEVLENFDIDVALLAINATKHGGYASEALPVALEKNVGVMAMKIFRNLTGEGVDVQELMNYSMSQKGVHSAMVGHYGIDILEENVRLIKAFRAQSDMQQEKTAAKVAHLAGAHALCWARPDYRDDGSYC